MTLSPKRPSAAICCRLLSQMPQSVAHHKKKSFFSFNALTFLLLFFWLLCPSCLLSVTIVFNRFLLCMAHAIGRYIAWPTENQQHLLACPHFQLLHAHKTSHYIIFNSIKVSLSLFIWHLFKLKNAKYGKR